MLPNCWGRRVPRGNPKTRGAWTMRGLALARPMNSASQPGSATGLGLSKLERRLGTKVLKQTPIGLSRWVTDVMAVSESSCEAGWRAMAWIGFTRSLGRQPGLADPQVKSGHDICCFNGIIKPIYPPKAILVQIDCM